MQTLRNPGTVPARLVLALALACLLAWYGVLGLRPLFNPDEGRYGEIPREMSLTNDYVVPRLNGVVYLEKPPLQYWGTALAMEVFGYGEWVVRLYCATSAVLAIGFVYLLGRRWRDAEYGTSAAAIAASMLLYVGMGQMTTLDMALAALLTVAIVAFCLGQRARERDPAGNRRWMLACWAAMALATLQKGLIGIVIPGAVLVLYTLLHRDFAVWRHLRLRLGLALYVVLALPWFLLVERDHRGALDFLIVREHFQRYLTKVHDRFEPWWWFGPVLALGVLPWLPQALRALATGWRAAEPRGRFDTARLLWVAATFIFVFFSISDSKLAPYIVPMLPLLALLGARRDEAGARDLRAAAWVQVGFGVLVALLVAIAAARMWKPEAAWIVRALTPWLLGIALVQIASGLAARVAARRSHAAGTLTLAAGAFCASLLLISPGAASIADKYSALALVRQAGPIPSSAPIYSVRTYDWTLPYYYGRPLIPVEWRGELDYGLNFEPAHGVPTVDEFRRRWLEAPAAYALMSEQTEAALAAAGLPMRRLALNDGDVIVSRR
jgi:4-amino-4-deoxy-L-arabinose transferase-like glycosyltransferase